MKTKATSLEVRSPFDQKVLATLPLTPQEQALKTMARLADGAKQRLKDFPMAKRYEALEKFVNLLNNDRENLIKQSVLEGGKPLQDTKIEMDRAIFGVKETLGCLTKWAGHQIPMGATAASAGRTAFTERTPLGLVLALSAFNHPINLFIHQVIPALAIGAPVIYKPASETPLTSQRMTALLYQAGFSEQDLMWMVCANETAEAMVGDSHVRVLSFIGSAKVGWALRGKLNPGARLMLEHGGVAPVVIAPDYDPNAAIPLLLKGGYYHAGQVCISVQNIFVPEAQLDRLVATFSSKVAALKVGDPALETTEVGPIIRQKDIDRIDTWVHEAKQSGGTIACGGEKLSGQCYAPTVVVNPSKTSRLATEEIFGPVTSIFGYKNIDDVIQQINALPTGFQSSIFTNVMDTAWKVGHALETAAMLVNDHTAFRVDWMPFQGIKQSGFGTGGILNTMEEYSYEKLWVFKY